MTIKLGLIGHPVSHSLSPVLHEAALRHLGWSGEFLLFDILENEVLMELARLARDGFTGISVTVPHKQVVIPHLGTLTSAASQCEAVNAVRFLRREPPETEGHNTDMAGFLHALMHHRMHEQAQKRVCVLGAGGAARAALWALNSTFPQKITLAARQLEKAQTLLRHIQPRIDWKTAVESCTLDEAAERSFDLLINCTPLGLEEGEELPPWAGRILVQSLASGSAVFDMVYGKSLFAAPCRQLKLHFADGLEMLIGQAALAFGYWTGESIPVSVMRDAVAQVAGLDAAGQLDRP
jgi:shikimate dehydrogenase